MVMVMDTAISTCDSQRVPLSFRKNRGTLLLIPKQENFGFLNLLSHPMVLNRWNSQDAPEGKGILTERVYSSRLLGQDPALVMHGGGNTSVKGTVNDIFGNPIPVLFIKGSGWDLGSIEAAGFPAVRMERLLPLRKLSRLGDSEMMNELRTSLVDSKAPDPSVETLLHAFLPHRFIDHTHADSILTLSNQPNGEDKLRAIFGDRLAYVPYVMPGFQLAKACAEIFENNPTVQGLILLKHGIFTFGESAKESYDRMIQFVNEAENAISAYTKNSTKTSHTPHLDKKSFWMNAIREECLRRSFPCVLRLDESQTALDFVNHPEAALISQRGPLTPDHVIRTKRLPLYLSPSLVAEAAFEKLADCFNDYEKQYQSYFLRNCDRAEFPISPLDPIPRVVLIPGIGIISVGTTSKEAAIISDIYRHTASCILAAERMSGYAALDEKDIFDVEYWVLEQAKLKIGGQRPPLAGKIALITGGFTGIGKAITKEFLASGAQVFVLDINTSARSEASEEFSRCRRGGANYCSIIADVSKRPEVKKAIYQVVESCGGIDVLVLNAGVFPSSSDIESISLEDWDKSLRVNLDGSFHVLAESLKWMKSSKHQMGRHIIFISSKNALAPGKGAAAYSVAKAGQTQLARVCALEAAPFGIRVNVLHPHLILDTPLWNDELIDARAKAYGMSRDAYCTNNLLKTNLSSHDVAKAVLSLVSGTFEKSTGLQIPIDGGSDRTL